MKPIGAFSDGMEKVSNTDGKSIARVIVISSYYKPEFTPFVLDTFLAGRAALRFGHQVIRYFGIIITCIDLTKSTMFI